MDDPLSGADASPPKVPWLSRLTYHPNSNLRPPVYDLLEHNSGYSVMLSGLRIYNKQ